MRARSFIHTTLSGTPAPIPGLSAGRTRPMLERDPPRVDGVWPIWVIHGRPSMCVNHSPPATPASRTSFPNALPFRTRGASRPSTLPDDASPSCRPVSAFPVFRPFTALPTALPAALFVTFTRTISRQNPRDAIVCADSSSSPPSALSSHMVAMESPSPPSPSPEWRRGPLLLLLLLLLGRGLRLPLAGDVVVAGRVTKMVLGLMIGRVFDFVIVLVSFSVFLFIGFVFCFAFCVATETLAETLLHVLLLLVVVVLFVSSVATDLLLTVLGGRNGSRDIRGGPGGRRWPWAVIPFPLFCTGPPSSALTPAPDPAPAPDPDPAPDPAPAVSVNDSTGPFCCPPVIGSGLLFQRPAPAIPVW